MKRKSSRTPIAAAVALATLSAAVACDAPDDVGTDDLEREVPNAFDEVNEDLSLLNEDELDAMSGPAPIDEDADEDQTDFRISYGAPDGSVHREVVWIPQLGCSGVTLSERYILTAAHCVDAQLGWPSQTRGPIGNIQVRYSGDGVTSSIVYSGGASATMDPGFNPFSICMASERDMALIRLNGDASQFVRARWHNMAIEPNVVTHEVVGWGSHGAMAGSPTNAGVLRMVGWMNSHGWDAQQGINLVGSSLTDPGDSGGGYFIRPGSSTRILVGTHACYVSDIWNQGADGPRVSTHVPWILGEAAALGRPLTCSKSSLYGIPYFYACRD